jgi:DNA polymerase-3 subunit chi
MSEINFYHLTRSSLEQTLPELLEKTLARNWRAVVMASSPERVESLAQLLWTYRTDSFLPHGSKKDGNAAQQPIWLTTEDERPNEAEILFLTDGATSANLDAYIRVCNMFDGNNPELVEAARTQWKDWKAAGHTLAYWQQEDHGWTKQA